MEKFIHQQNLALFEKRLAEAHTDGEREVLKKLLRDEQAKELSSCRRSGRIEYNKRVQARS